MLQETVGCKKEDICNLKTCGFILSTQFKIETRVLRNGGKVVMIKILPADNNNNENDRRRHLYIDMILQFFYL